MRGIWYGFLWSMSGCLLVLDTAIGPTVEGSNGVFYFGSEHKNVFCRTTSLTRTKFAMEHEFDKFYWHFARHLDPLLLRACGQSIPKSDIFFKSLRNQLALNEIDMGNSVPYLAITLCAPYAWTPWKRCGGSTKSSHTFTKFSSS